MSSNFGQTLLIVPKEVEPNKTISKADKTELDSNALKGRSHHRLRHLQKQSHLLSLNLDDHDDDDVVLRLGEEQHRLV